jgi:SET domain-containing protein
MNFAEEFLASLPKPYIAPAIESKRSPIAGVGQFAKRDIEPEEVLAIEFGPIVDRSVAATIQKRLGYSVDTCVGWGRYSVQQPLEHDGEGGIMNHSCDPNVGLLSDGIYISIRPITRGQEACIDYGTFETWKDWQMQCNCGAENCRGTITSHDYELPDLQVRLGRWFAPYLRRYVEETRRQA